MLRIIILIAGIAGWFTVNAVPTRYAFTPQLKAAYSKVLNLRFQEAATQIARIKREDPNNLLVYYVENYIDILAAIIDENDQQYQRLRPNKDKRLSMLKKGDPKSPYFLFTQAQVRLYWALAGLKYGEYINAFSEVSKAYHLLEKNQETFPNFLPNKMSLGVMHALVGSIPDNYKWGVKLLSGMDGNVLQGMSEIEIVLKNSNKENFEFEEELQVMYTFLVLHLNNQRERAWTFISSGDLNPKESPLACFTLANVAMHSGRNDDAIRILQNKPTGRGFHTFAYLDFMLGCAKLYRMDADADIFLKKFLQTFRGKNYLKEAYQKLAWFYLLNGKMALYKQQIQLCKSRGGNDVGGDKNALNEAVTGIIPDLILLKARLLFDGGYYQRAYDLLRNKQVGDFKTRLFQIEFYYRNGRITQMLNKTQEAIVLYQRTIDLGKNDASYYACNAALQLGIIYENAGQKDKAKSYYGYCLKLDPEDYADGLHGKAKAGLNRLRKQ